LVVGYPAGGGTDITARLIAQWLSERLGQQFVVENRAGAGTNIGTEAVMRAPADGYTLLLAHTANAINATLYEKLNFNFIRDIVAVACIMRVPGVMVVNPSLPAKTVPEFIAYAKANPGKINMASGGAGGPDHMSGELFKTMTGVNMLHVPYRGLSPALTDLLGGQVQVIFSSLPDIPTVGDTVPNYEASQWYGVIAPKNTPIEIVDRLNREINSALADPNMKNRLAELGGTLLPGSPADFGKLIADETEKWAKVVRASGAEED
jgi:tripartite-type tricarboxylate transporter receptor subunit TctC